MMKQERKKDIASWGIVALIFAGVSLVNFFVFNVLKENNHLESRNACERSMNDFIALLRQYDSAEEAMAVYEERFDTKIIGVGGYSRDGAPLFQLGEAPEELTVTMLSGEEGDPRAYIPDAQNRSLVIIQRRPPGPDKRPPPDMSERSDLPEGADPAAMTDNSGELQEEDPRHMFNPEIYYWEIHQPTFWNRTVLYRVLFPGIEIALAALILYVFFLIRKNTEYRKRIEEQKNLVIIGTAASTLAHEIKNPLSVIRLQTDLIRRNPGGGVDRELKIIDEETERLTTLAHHVNDYLRDPVGNPDKLSAAEVLREHARRVFGAEVPVTSPDQELYISFDRARFQSVIGNLLMNALESGSGPDGVSVSVDRKGSMVRIEISDRGKGIPARKLDRIFDPFYTTKSSGTGVGLSVVQRFVEAAGGRLSIRNRTEGGVTVTVELPEYKQ